MSCRSSLIGSAAIVVSMALAVLPAWAGSDGLRSEGHSTTAGFCPQTVSAKSKALVRHDAVMAAASALPLPMASANSPDIASALLEQNERRVRVGRVVHVGSSVEFLGLRARDLRPGPRPHAGGEVRSLPTGGFFWLGALKSRDAAAIRLHIRDMYLPRNAALYLHGDEGEVFGPYTGRGPQGNGTFWSNTLRGDRVVVEVRYEGSDVERALRATRFAIDDLGHLTPEFLFARYREPDAATGSGAGFCSDNAACVTNAECNTLATPIALARDAIAHIQFVSGAFLYICSGGLVADTDPASVIPHFLTANHCLSRQKEAATVEAYFQFVTPCGGSCVLGDQVPRTLGASVSATNRTGDYTLLRLAEPAPVGSYFLGWEAQEIAHTGGTPLFRIHHPKGSPQAYSEHVVDTTKPTCRSWPRGPWIYSHDTLGAVEGGSSGSPVLDATGKLVGQLSGACGYDVSQVCESGSNATVDGAFAGYFPSVASILDPAGSCSDADGDGFCAESDDCNDADPFVNPGVLEVCDDGLDNDCNGVSDSEDPACQTGSCDLSPVGVSCASDSECCTGKCRGPASRKSCR